MFGPFGLRIKEKARWTNNKLSIILIEVMIRLGKTNLRKHASLFDQKRILTNALKTIQRESDTSKNK
jgi:hypothetical protein